MFHSQANNEIQKFNCLINWFFFTIYMNVVLYNTELWFICISETSIWIPLMSRRASYAYSSSLVPKNNAWHRADILKIWTEFNHVFQGYVTLAFETAEGINCKFWLNFITVSRQWSRQITLPLQSPWLQANNTSYYP